MTRSFPKIPEEVRSLPKNSEVFCSLPKTSKVCGRRSYRVKGLSTKSEIARKVLSFIHFTHGFRSLHGSKLTYFWKLCQARRQLACVESVSSRGSSRKPGQDQKKLNDGGGGEERRNRLPANPTILKNCVRPRTQLLICAPQTFLGVCQRLRDEPVRTSAWEARGLWANVSSSPLPLPLQPFFCFRSSFRAITRLETLATQARRQQLTFFNQA